MISPICPTQSASVLYTGNFSFFWDHPWCMACRCCSHTQDYTQGGRQTSYQIFKTFSGPSNGCHQPKIEYFHTELVHDLIHSDVSHWPRPQALWSRFVCFEEIWRKICWIPKMASGQNHKLLDCHNSNLWRISHLRSQHDFQIFSYRSLYLLLCWQNKASERWCTGDLDRMMLGHHDHCLRWCSPQHIFK